MTTSLLRCNEQAVSLIYITADFIIREQLCVDMFNERKSCSPCFICWSMSSPPACVKKKYSLCIQWVQAVGSCWSFLPSLYRPALTVMHSHSPTAHSEWAKKKPPWKPMADVTLGECSSLWERLMIKKLKLHNLPFEVALHFIKTTPPVDSLSTFSPEVTCWLSYYIYNFRLDAVINDASSMAIKFLFYSYVWFLGIVVEKVLMFVSWLYSCSYDVCCVAGLSSRWHPDSRPAGGYGFRRLSLHVQPALSSRWSRDGCNSQSKVSFSHIVATILTYDNLYLQYINVSMFSSSCS